MRIREGFINEREMSARLVHLPERRLQKSQKELDVPCCVHHLRTGNHLPVKTRHACDELRRKPQVLDVRHAISSSHSVSTMLAHNSLNIFE